MTDRSRTWAASILLVLGVVFVYAPVGGHDWVSYDDHDYVLENPHVKRGLTRDGIAWAFTHEHFANYHPLTWLSHMLDVELFVLEPGPHHWVNVGLHALNAVLALCFLRSLVDSVPAAAIGAALFALHPLRVESVAWISERKDVLCASFYLAALLAYLRYGRAPSRGRYLVVVVGFALALLSKPMAVTFPLVALLLDVWPLARMSCPDSRKPRAPAPVAAPSQPPTHPGESRRGLFLYGGIRGNLLLEKLPLLVLAALAAATTLWAQSGAGATSSLGSLAPELRTLNALRSVGVYLWQSLVPRGLSVFYPHAAIRSPEPARALLPAALAGGALVVAGLVCAWRTRRAAPAVTVGIGLFLVTLLPVIGLVQVGTQAHADRYTYLPSLGLAAAVAGAGVALPARRLAGVLGVLAAVALAALARAQVAVWRDTRALFAHALLLDPQNYVAHAKLGELALDEGDEPGARAAFLRALAIHPRDAHALKKLALCHREAGELDLARERLEQALALEPGDPEVLANLGTVELERGEADAARRWYAAALARSPDDPDAHFNLGVLAQRTGELEEAERRFEAALALAPEHADAWSNLGQVRLARGRLQEALAAFEEAVALAPEDPLARYNLGVARRSRGDLAGARQAFLRALELEPGFDLARSALEGLERGD